MQDQQEKTLFKNIHALYNYQRVEVFLNINSWHVRFLTQ